MLGIFRRRPSPAMVVAVIALVAALSGTAAALHGHNSVRSDDIKNGQVKTRDLANRAVKTRKLGHGAVTPGRADLTESRKIGGAGVTSSSTPTDLGGPSVKVTVPPGGLVAVYAKAQMSVTGSNHNATVRLFEPSAVPGNAIIMQSDKNTLTQRFTTPGSNDGNGVGSQTRAGWLVLSPPPGTYTFSLRYSASGGTATFANRALYVTVLP
jgi:hypothetical protein